MRFIVTIRFGYNDKHNPKKKVVGPCPWSDQCTDSTGSHHSLLVEAADKEMVENMFSSYHITRIENVDKW